MVYLLHLEGKGSSAWKKKKAQITSAWKSNNQMREYCVQLSKHVLTGKTHLRARKKVFLN
jgi:hypothetical protein